MTYFLGHDPQALAPKEKDSAEAIGSEVDKEINATAEVRDETVKEVVDSSSVNQTRSYILLLRTDILFILFLFTS